MNITILGDICIDENTVEGASYTSFGGPALYMDIILKHLPTVSYKIVANWGSDLKPYISNLDNMLTSMGDLPSLKYKNISTSLGRVQYAEVSDSKGEFNVDFEILKKHIGWSDLIIFSPLTPFFDAEYLASILKHKSDSAKTIILPQGYFREILDNTNVVKRDFVEEKEVLSLFDFAIVSEEDGENMHSTAAFWATKYGLDVVVTIGEKGAKLYSKTGGDMRVGTIANQNIVDSTGSGDIFSIAFGTKYVQSQNVEESISFANKMAGLCLSYTPIQMQKSVEFADKVELLAKGLSD